MYSRIIDEVIQSSQVNFEEDGVDQQTLNEMRTVSLPPFSLGVSHDKIARYFHNIPWSLFELCCCQQSLTVGITLIVVVVLVVFRAELDGRTL